MLFNISYIRDINQVCLLLLNRLFIIGRAISGFSMG